MPPIKEKKRSPAGSTSYQGLIDTLRSAVNSGRWTPGSMLPSRVALSREHGVSLTTVQQAVAQLVGEGILHADGGRGTFVTRGPETHNASPGDAIPGSPIIDGLNRITIGAQRLSVAGATLGIIDCLSLRTDEFRTDGLGWIESIATHLENAFHNVGGLSRFFDPKENRGHTPLADAIDAFQSEQVDALAIIGIYEDPAIALELPSLLDWVQTPAVYISWTDAPADFPHVFYDNYLAASQAVRHLQARHYGRLAYISMKGLEWSNQRLSGAQAASDNAVEEILLLTEAQLLDDNKRVRLLTEWLQQTLKVRKSDTDAAPWGIIAGNDWISLHLQNAAQTLGLTAGPDFGLIGFDNNPRSRIAGLTTLRPPSEALGEQAAQMLLNQIRGDKTCIQTRLNSQLLPRASTHR